jgi:hypothetical protein
MSVVREFCRTGRARSCRWYLSIMRRLTDDRSTMPLNTANSPQIQGMRIRHLTLLAGRGRDVTVGLSGWIARYLTSSLFNATLMENFHLAWTLWDGMATMSPSLDVSRQTFNLRLSEVQCLCEMDSIRSAPSFYLPSANRRSSIHLIKTHEPPKSDSRWFWSGFLRYDTIR